MTLDMESVSPRASIDKKDTRESADVLALYEPTEGDRRWIMLHVLLRKGSPRYEEEPLRLPNTFNDWCAWRDENAEATTGTHHVLRIPRQPEGHVDREPVDRETLQATRLRHPVGRRDEERVQTGRALAHVGCHTLQGQCHALLVGDGFAKRTRDSNAIHPSLQRSREVIFPNR
jgi:hypothetical protein